MIKITISENEAGQRLDRFLRKYLRKAPLSAIYRMIRKDVKVNGRKAGEETILSAGDCLTLYLTAEKLEAFTAPIPERAARRQFGIAYEDDDVLIVDKPKGLLTHGDAREKKNTLVNQVCGYLQEKDEFLPSREKTFVPAPVNRLDRNTTGLVVFGKNAAALRNLTQIIRERDGIEKYYITILCGCLEEPLLLQDRLVKDSSSNRTKTADSADSEGGKAAATYARPLHTAKGFTLAEVRIFTGRTHQIRVHLAGAGFPLAGDAKYGNPRENAVLKKLGATTQLLHASRLAFTDVPAALSGLAGRIVEAPLPSEFSRVKDALGL